MAQDRVRRQRPSGLLFYTTALVVCSFVTFGVLKSQLRPNSHNAFSLHARDLVRRDEECRLVHSAADKCVFVKANCPDEEAGLVSYLQLYYCSLPNAKPLGVTILTVWISLLFSTIGIAASDFLCVNLSTIATILGMSESLTGVTFLAFGNGSPDVFSTFAAMSSHSGSLAVGELIGAAGFITAVVAGSMAIVRPFKVARKSFVRDVGFFVVAASFSLVFLADGNLRLWECITMVAFYVFYVIFVVFWHWWQQRSRRKKLAETAARLHAHIPEQQELEAPDIEIDDESQPTSERTPMIRDQSQEAIFLPYDQETPSWKVEDFNDDDDVRNRYLAELSSNMRVNRRGRHSRRNTANPIRPSLIGALEFRAVLQSLENKSSTGRPIYLRRYSDDPSQLLDSNSAAPPLITQPELITISDNSEDDHGSPGPAVYGRTRAVSEGDALGLHIRRDLLQLAKGTPETVIYDPASPTGLALSGASDLALELSQSPGTLTPRSGNSSPSSKHAVKNGLLAPPDNYFDRLSQQHNRSYSPAFSGAVSPNTLGPNAKPTRQRSRAGSIALPPPLLSPDSPYRLESTDDELDFGSGSSYRWWPYDYLPAPEVILSTLFPTLYGWRSKSIVDRLLGVVTAPSVFLLTITLPIVEAKQDDETTDREGLLSSPEIVQNNIDVYVSSSPNRIAPLSNDFNGGRTHSWTSENAPLSHEQAQHSSSKELSELKTWNRWLVVVQIFTAPLFVVSIVFANLEEGSGFKLYIKLILGSLVFSLICLLILLTTTVEDREPKYRPLFCFLGFAVAVAWISAIANEVVGVLKAFGVIFDISDAILGLTIFAVGNSLGDLVADVTVAKLGYPVMALSACFGGPMLNILLGIGVGGLYMTLHNAAHRHEKHPDKAIKYKPYELQVSTTLMISGITLLLTLLGLLIVVPLNGWMMDRRVGIGLIVVWACSTAINVVLEVAGVGSEWIFSS